MAKIAQSQADLETHLVEQVDFLISSAQAYDQGTTAEAKRLALSLRVLLHETASSHSLLRQVGLRVRKFVDSAKDVVVGNLLTHSPLVALNVRFGHFVPLLDSEYFETSFSDFDPWWSRTIFVDKEGHELSRKDIVLFMANQDGGAHVDPGLEARYRALSRDNSLGWEHQNKRSGLTMPVSGSERAAVRQIAHEVLKTLLPGYECAHGPEDGPIVANISIVRVSDEKPSGGIPHEVTEFAIEGDRLPDRVPLVSGLRCNPSVPHAYADRHPAGRLCEGARYRAEIKIDSISCGEVRVWIGGGIGPSLTSAGLHTAAIRAGPLQRIRIEGIRTDAVISRLSVREILTPDCEYPSVNRSVARLIQSS